MAKISKIPASDNGPKLKCTTRKGAVYVISQQLAPMKFTLWKETDGGYEKIATANSPLELDEKIPWES